MSASSLVRWVASGATAELYETDDGRLFKQFHPGCRPGSIDNEYNCTLFARHLGLGAPKVYERANDHRGNGFIMEYIHGSSLLDTMLSDREALPVYMEKWVALQKELSSHSGEGLPAAHSVLAERLQRSRLLLDVEKAGLLRLLDRLPRGTRVCHTDLHPGNIMITDTDWRIIDWCDLMQASPAADVARVMLILLDDAVPDRLSREAVTYFRSAGRPLYLREVDAQMHLSQEEIRGWMAILAGVKLDGEPKGRDSFLLPILRLYGQAPG